MRNQDDIKSNISYQRLARLQLWPLIAFALLSAIFSTVLVAAVYMETIPSLAELGGSPAMAESLDRGIRKIVLVLTSWIVVLFQPFIFLLYVVWNIKRLVRLIEE